MAYSPPDEATPHDVTDGETLESIADGLGATTADLALFNFGTSDPLEVDRALFEIVGARKRTVDDSTYEFSSADHARGTGRILIPKEYAKDGLAAGKTFIFWLNRLIPMAAVEITQLDKWFVPGEAAHGGETCDIEYRLEGLASAATQVDFEVYASNYCSASMDDDYEVEFEPVESVIPIFKQTLPDANAVPRTSLSVGDWRGQCNAASGMLKPRSGGTRHVNVAFSPYTVLLRFYREAADAQARILLEDFWPRWDNSGAIDSDSLDITWKIENTDRLKYGELLIIDRTDAVVYRDALDEEWLSSGDHTYHWDGKLTDGTTLQAGEMPYRVQIQAHTGLNEDAGLALAAMHTEVRLFVDAATGAHPNTPFQDPNSLTLNLAPYSPDVPSPSGDRDRYVQDVLARAGYHPGPLDGSLGRDETEIAIAEFQRTIPRQVSPGRYQRLDPSGDVDDETLDALAWQLPDARPMFGNPTNRNDITPTSSAAATLTDATHADGLIVWVDDRHYYTESQPKGFPDHFDLDNYREDFNCGDDRVDYDGESVARPWIPMMADVPLLAKDFHAGVAATNSVVNDASRSAIGPLRVDWVFEELEPDLAAVDMTHAAYVTTEVRTHRWIQETLHRHRATHNGRTYTNCPEDLGGIRPDTPAEYYRALVMHEDLSLLPWVAYDDSARQVICTIAHDDCGQPTGQLHADHRGRAGVFYQTSRIAGDGYRFGARVAFDDIDDAPSNFPNWAVLARRYPQRPQAYTCPLRLWRKTSYRGHLNWCAAHRWPANRQPAQDLFRPALLHYVDESSQTTGAFVQMSAPTLLGLADYQRTVRSNVTREFRRLPIRLNANHVWPYLNEKRWGVPVSEPGVTFQDMYDKVLEPLFGKTWRRFREELIWRLLATIERDHGLMKGHLLVEFSASPVGIVHQYQCPSCHADFVEFVENLPAAEQLDQLPCPACGTGHKGSGAKPVRTVTPNPLRSTLRLPAVGVGMGATWVFFTHDGSLWPHEMGHHRHLEHAQSNPRSATDTAPGAQNDQHDSQPNTFGFGAGAAGKEECWDHRCIMSYNHRDPRYFCGKCVLKLRGWRVEDEVNPGGNVHD